MTLVTGEDSKGAPPQAEPAEASDLGQAPQAAVDAATTTTASCSPYNSDFVSESDGEHVDERLRRSLPSREARGLNTVFEEPVSRSQDVQDACAEEDCFHENSAIKASKGSFISRASSPQERLSHPTAESAAQSDSQLIDDDVRCPKLSEALGNESRQAPRLTPELAEAKEAELDSVQARDERPALLAAEGDGALDARTGDRPSLSPDHVSQAQQDTSDSDKPSTAVVNDAAE